MTDLPDHTPAPADLVPGHGLTRESLDRMAAAAGRMTTVTSPGEVIEGSDGVPAAVGPPTERQAWLSHITISRTEAEALGITEETHPRVRVSDVPPTNQEDA